MAPSTQIYARVGSMPLSFDLLCAFRPGPAGSLLAGRTNTKISKNPALDNQPRPRASFFPTYTPSV